MNDNELDAILETWEAPKPSPALREGVRRSLPTGPRKRSYGWLAAAASVVATTSLLGVAMLGRGQAHLSDGTYIQNSLQVEPAAARERWHKLGHGLSTGGNRQRGYYYNTATHTYTGYDLSVQPLGGRKYLMSVQPLTTPFRELAAQADAAEYREVALPSMPPARIVRQGELFDIDLMRDPQSGDRVFERIELSQSSFEGLASMIQAHHLRFIHWVHGLLHASHN